MRIYIPDMDKFLSWMDKSGYAYVILRGFENFKDSWPVIGTKPDVDLLVEDAALPQIYDRYRRFTRRQGVKCDFYNVKGSGAGSYLGVSYFPKTLAQRMLSTRIMWENKFYVPADETHFLSLLYHITYQKAEKSGIHEDNVAKSITSKYVPALDALTKTLNIDLPYTLSAFHDYLTKKNMAITPDTLAHIARHDFEKHNASMFRARVCAQQKGELNLFVLRQCVIDTGMTEQILAALAKEYKILTTKDIPFMKQFSTRKKMRGGKWKRGGKPAIAVIVYDPAPIPMLETDKALQPHVLNRRQFMKRALREWYTETTKSKASDNPIHSTDHEIEAIGHLPLFFTEAEQKEILQTLSTLRQETCAQSNAG